jgi:eukaryotic-like serine/threonine-protein kinase
MVLACGTRLGPYGVVSSIGAGGMGEVYRARDTRLGRDVAIKVMPTELASDPGGLRRFELEARSAGQLNHPNVLAVYDVGTHDGAPYIVTELLEGETLAARLRGAGLTARTAVELGVQVTQGLAAAHERGIIHRDLKPANIFLTRDGVVKILDFGLAKHVEASSVREQESQQATQDKGTEAGVMLGTIGYMSPEQVRGQSVDHRTDIFAFGCVLYEMLSGRSPFLRGTPADTLAAILGEDPSPLAASGRAVAPALQEIVNRCLEKRAQDRFSSAHDLALALHAISASSDTPEISRPARPAPTTKGKAQRRLAFAAGAIAIVACAGLLVWLVRPRARDRPSPPRTEFLQLTSQPGVEWFPSLSPDGKWIVYAGTGTGSRHIYLQSVGGQKPLDLTGDSTDDNDQPAFSPDSERIAFRSSRDDGGIFVMGRTGEAIRRVTRAGFRPAWSPDGKQLAFTTENVELNPQNAQGRSELWSVAVDGGEPRRIYEGDAVLASFSPNNRRIAFTRRISNPFQADVCTIAVSGGAVVPVTNDRWTDWSPVWSPDGNFVYFASDRGGSMNLWRVPVNEVSGTALGEPEPITAPAAILAHPSISADGKRIAYTSALVTANIQRQRFDPATWLPTGDPAWVTTGSRRWSSPDPSPGGDWIAFYSLTQPEGNVYVARPDGTGLRQVTGDAAIDRVPRWSPDGKWLTFFSTRSGLVELWKIRPDGSDLAQITDGGASYFAWSPEGKRIATARSLAERPADRGVVVFDPNLPWKQQSLDVLPPMDAVQGRFLVNSWSPDGERLAGQIDMPGRGLAVYSIRSRTYERLSDFGEWPVWLPDSRRILFVADGKAFYVLDSRSKKTRKILSVTADVIGPPRLARDGTAYFSRRVTEADVWMVTLK